MMIMPGGKPFCWWVHMPVLRAERNSCDFSGGSQGLCGIARAEDLAACCLP